MVYDAATPSRLVWADRLVHGPEFRQGNIGEVDVRREGNCRVLRLHYRPKHVMRKRSPAVLAGSSRTLAFDEHDASLLKYSFYMRLTCRRLESPELPCHRLLMNPTGICCMREHKKSSIHDPHMLRVSYLVPDCRPPSDCRTETIMQSCHVIPIAPHFVFRRISPGRAAEGRSTIILLLSSSLKTLPGQAMTWLRLRLSATLFIVKGRPSSLLGVRAFASLSGDLKVGHRTRHHAASTRAVVPSLRLVPPVRHDTGTAMSTTSGAAVGEGAGDGKAAGTGEAGIGAGGSGSGGNRLAGETSPYLLQHADNPVHWMPWGEEAFRKAREEDKPIYLSVGYSTCHW